MKKSSTGARNSRQALGNSARAEDGSGKPRPRKRRRSKRRPEDFLQQIGLTARQCREFERQFGQNPPPELDTLLKLHRVLAFRLTTGTDEDTASLRAMANILRPLLAWAALEEKRRDRAFAKQKYREQLEIQKAAIQRELEAARGQGGVGGMNLDDVERRLGLM
jgi:hypothetical protein